MFRQRRLLLAHGLTALAGGIGAWIFLSSLLVQYHRLALYTHDGAGFRDPDCLNGYCDTTMFWLAGTFARRGWIDVLYNHARFAAAAATILPYSNGYWRFVYPPPMLLPSALLSLAPLVAGYFAFSAVATMLGARILRGAGIAWWCILLGLASPAGMWNLYLGQFGLLCGALLFAGLAGLQTQPIRAGVLLGLLCIKPQYALLVPVVVLAARCWRVLAAGAVTVAALAALSLALGGSGLWVAFLVSGRAGMAAMLDQPTGFQAMGSSVFWMVRSFGASLAAAYAVQGVVSACCAAVVWRLWRRAGPPPAAATVFLTLLASPYGYTDDLAIYSVLLPCLASRGSLWRNAMLAWLWVAPGFVPRFVAHFGFLPTPLLVMAALALALQKVDWRAADTRVPAPQADRPRPAPAAPRRAG